ncbi:MAG: hypothetical protein WC899_02200 [bacterium]|jgi:hypothetical protein
MTKSSKIKEPYDGRFFPQEYGRFRKDILIHFVLNVLNGTRSVFDPMAGSAPLLPVAQASGVATVLSDMLPVHYYVNKAKTINVWREAATFERKRKMSISDVILECLSEVGDTRLLVSDDWFPREIFDGLRLAWKKTDDYPGLMPFLLKGLLLLSLRGMASFWTTQRNCYWHRPGGLTSAVPLQGFIGDPVDKFRQLWKYYDSNVSPEFTPPRSEFFICDAAEFRVRKRFQTIITSPPYPNRFDYSRMFGPELSFLSQVPGEHQDWMNLRPIGTNSVRGFVPTLTDTQYIASHSRSAAKFLAHVAKRGKKRESDYYYKYFMLYYLKLFRTIENMVHLLSINGTIYIVVQENMHRDELNPLGKCCTECLSSLGLKTDADLKWLVGHQGRRNINSVYIKQHREFIVRATRP